MTTVFTKSLNVLCCAAVKPSPTITRSRLAPVVPLVSSAVAVWAAAGTAASRPATMERTRFMASLPFDPGGREGATVDRERGDGLLLEDGQGEGRQHGRQALAVGQLVQAQCGLRQVAGCQQLP